MHMTRRRLTRLGAAALMTPLIGLFGAVVAPQQASAVTVDFTPVVTPSPAHYGATETVSTPGLPAGSTGRLYYTDQYQDSLCEATLPDTSCTFTENVFAGDTLTVTSNYLDAGGNPVGNGSVDVPVTKSDVTATVTTPARTVDYGAAVEFDLAGFPADASGTVEVQDQNGATLCTMSVPSGPSCTASPAPGDYTFTGAYSGDGQHNSGTLAGGPLTVAKGATEVAASPYASDYSSPVTFVVGSLPPQASGTVDIRRADNALLCSVNLAQSGNCSSAARSLPAGQVTVTVAYSGDDAFRASSTTETFDIAKASASFTTSGTGDYVQGRTPTVLSVDTLPADAAGTVTFTDANSTPLCTVDVSAARSCSPSTNLPVGDYQARAAYSGDANYTSATAGTGDVTFSVIDPETVKIPVRLTAVVNPASPDYLHGGKVTIGGLPAGATGTVTVVYPASYNARACVAELTGTGRVTCTLPPKEEPHAYFLVATYSGDATYRPATVTKHYTVARSAPTMRLTADKSSYHYGSFNTIHVLGMNKGQNGTVTFTDEHGKTVCSPTSPQPYNGVVTCPVVNLKVGTHTVTASYTGDAHYASGQTSMKITVLRALPKPKFVINVANGKHLVGKPLTILIGGLPKSATGMLGFFDEHGNLLCETKSPASSCTVSGNHVHALGAGKHVINGDYAGNAKFSPVHTSITVTMSRR
jgi:hypothetical protein